jgi:hypothetical protein
MSPALLISNLTVPPSPEADMTRLYGPIDREVQIAEMRYLQVLGRLETHRLIEQARHENGSRELFDDLSGLDRMLGAANRFVHAHFSRVRESLGTGDSAAA